MRNVIKKLLKHEQYERVLKTGDRMNSSKKMIRSLNHNIYTVNVNKVSFSAYDDERFIKDDGISSYAYGHYATPDCTEQVEDLRTMAYNIELSAIDNHFDKLIIIITKMELLFKNCDKNTLRLLFAHFDTNLTCKRLLGPIHGLLFARQWCTISSRRQTFQTSGTS